jgi:uncharacterized protein YoxC
MTKKSNHLYTVTFGGWYQRTTLHLSEIYELMILGTSKLPLSPGKLLELKKNLNLVSIQREVSSLEYILAETNNGITIKYYEDGLYILQTKSSDIKLAQKKLQDYFYQNLDPAVSYIFSLGAPTPKILAEIKNDHQVAVSLELENDKQFTVDSKEYGEVYSRICVKDYCVYKTPKYIFIITSKKAKMVEDLIEMQIFFREFKDHLERYLFIHRTLWEKISEIKEQRFVKGKDLEKIRADLDAHQKTINLISNRINQMNIYVNTRSSIAEKLHLTDELLTIFQYKFETLNNTHAYIKEIWKMTSDFLNQAIQVVVEAQNKSTDNSIQSLRTITTIGVLAGLIGYFGQTAFPSFTLIGFWYFLILIIGTWSINKIVAYIHNQIKYELEFSQNKT